MKVVILAGGFGTRLSEETVVKPKPMVEIGGRPILWHIMKIYSSYGYNEFIVLLGYKGRIIKDYFYNYLVNESDITVNLQTNHTQLHTKHNEPWSIQLIDTGLNTMTGGRVKRISKFIDDAPFLLTYGDGVADVNVEALVQFHRKSGKLITMTAVQPEGRYGALDLRDDGSVTSFIEKPKGEGAGSWINGGFFVCDPKILDYIDDDSTVFEQEPLSTLADQEELMAYRHRGFWGCMDTLRDKTKLSELWDSGHAPWRNWP